jgi:hypothetical protein
MTDPIDSNNNNDDADTALSANIIIAQARAGCIDRGEGLKPMHVYLEGATECVCGEGPLLELRGMK